MMASVKCAVAHCLKSKIGSDLDAHPFRRVRTRQAKYSSRHQPVQEKSCDRKVSENLVRGMGRVTTIWPFRTRKANSSLGLFLCYTLGMHKYSLGQTVHYSGEAGSHDVAGEYEI